MNPSNFVNALRATLDIYAIHRQHPSISPTSHHQEFKRVLEDPQKLLQSLHESGAEDFFDVNTIMRALSHGPEFLQSDQDDNDSNDLIAFLTHVDVITSVDQLSVDAPVVCLDLMKLGNIESVIAWAKRHGEEIRAAGRLLFLAVGNDGCDLSEVGKYVDGTIERPTSNSTWLERVRPLWTALKTPEKVDNLPANKVHGGMSDLAFAETLTQAAR